MGNLSSSIFFISSVVGKIIAPQKCPHPNLWQLLPYMEKGTLDVIKLKVLKLKIVLGYLVDPN